MLGIILQNLDDCLSDIAKASSNSDFDHFERLFELNEDVIEVQ